MQQGTVSSAERLSQGVIAWPQNAEFPQVKNRAKKEKNIKNRRPRRPWDPIFPPHGYPLGPPRPPRALRIKVTNRSPTGRDLFLFTYLTVEAQTNLSQ